MGKGNQMEGGFAYLNGDKGHLENCYAAVRIKGRKCENAGFVYENRGTISHCFTRSHTSRWKQSQKKDDKKKDGFCSLGNGIIHKSFFLEKKEKRLENYRDSELGLTIKQADCQFLQEQFDWDFRVFEEKNASKMDFLAENWNYTLPKNTESENADPENTGIERIHTEQELTDLIDRINRGNKKAACGYYELDSDLDFHGRELMPIGWDQEHPFEGIFDGKGHMIRGFVLKGKDRPVLGLFGYLEGMVVNLRADGIVKGKNCRMAASFCAVNKGEIHCCEAVFEIHSKYNLGMFVGENHGLIERCSMDGKSHGIFFFALFPLLPLIALAIACAFNPPKPPADYNPIPEDRSIVPNPEDNSGKRSNENKASYEVPKILEVDANTLTVSDGQYVIKNPNRGANYDFVATIYMTDSLGQQVEVYTSGRIPTGYHITALTLTPPKDIVLSKGSYDAQITFSFYNQDTGEKGMIDSTVPIKIKIK